MFKRIQVILIWKEQQDSLEEKQSLLAVKRMLSFLRSK